MSKTIHYITLSPARMSAAPCVWEDRGTRSQVTGKSWPAQLLLSLLSDLIRRQCPSYSCDDADGTEYGGIPAGSRIAS